MSTYQESVAWGTRLLCDAQIPEAEVDAWYLFEHVTGLSRASYFLKLQEEMPEAQKEAFRTVLEQRLQRIPLQYITRVQEFMGFPFEVSEATLIPRQDTEVLVEHVMRYAENARVLDLCTGTGCIIISLAKLCHLERAVGSDFSGEALETAKKNAEKLEANVDFFCGDLWEALPEKEAFDIIVSNPPYIPTAEISELMPEVREHEPMTALDGDADGLAFYRRIAERAGDYLTKDGRIFFEIGCEQAEDVSGLLREHGFGEIQVIKDYAGLDRVVCGKRQA